MANQKALEQIIHGLNLDLAWEYAAGIQYAQHASMLRGAAYFAVAEELEKYANDEFGHAIVLSTLIQYLGGHINKAQRDDLTLSVGKIVFCFHL